MKLQRLFMWQLSSKKTIALISLIGIVTSVVVTCHSESYQKAKIAVLTDSKISQDFGKINFLFNYSSNIQTAQSDGRKIQRGYFRFYVFGQKKSGGVLVNYEAFDGTEKVTIEKP